MRRGAWWAEVELGLYLYVDSVRIPEDIPPQLCWCRQRFLRGPLNMSLARADEKRNLDRDRNDV